MIVGAASLPVGLFWFAWTSSPSMSSWPQILAGVPIGFGVQVILLQSLAYLIDIYTTKAASAISGTMIVRSLIGGTFPLFALQLYHGLGVRICPYCFHRSDANERFRCSGRQIYSAYAHLRLHLFLLCFCIVAARLGQWAGIVTRLYFLLHKCIKSLFFVWSSHHKTVYMLYSSTSSIEVRKL
jgi:hypothetical protein